MLDLRLPSMRGDTFYFLARARQPWPATQTLFITGDISTQAETIVRQTGLRLLQKPFRGEDLLLAVLALAPIVPRIADRAG